MTAMTICRGCLVRREQVQIHMAHGRNLRIGLGGLLDPTGFLIDTPMLACARCKQQIRSTDRYFSMKPCFCYCVRFWIMLEGAKGGS